ncbi:hypothetical protein DSC45_16975 [Streptomyces sp. YIM 130001]|uniref:hypothetical protein n=1 Tax=Streptomyces sp. YIM 130001 TaxID=2259644 RepID=UPI000E649A32|nr:hypothetical protein [Streptomyces sp. YIM 130001]RII15936.1 hypothetical protein DSC45_16975 [Streptomyces sp. YIM 130001]
MLSCPHCRSALPGLPARCYACRGDLGALRDLRTLADRHFNQAVRAARIRDWGTAREHLAVTLLLNPTDTEARSLLAKVRHHNRSAPRRSGSRRRPGFGR